MSYTCEFLIKTWVIMLIFRNISALLFSQSNIFHALSYFAGFTIFLGLPI